MKKDDSRLTTARELLAPAHHDYITTISTQGMALSLETSCLLWALCEITQPKSILDLGSGFSSYVVRLWSKHANHSIDVWSVDDDERWLPESKRFCETRGVDTTNFVTWEEMKSNQSKFDIVAYDLGRMQCRSQNLNAGLDFMSSNGIVIIDDMHKYNYHKEVVTTLQSRGLIGVDMKEVTIDRHEGRHCWLAAHRDLALELG